MSAGDLQAGEGAGHGQPLVLRWGGSFLHLNTAGASNLSTSLLLGLWEHPRPLLHNRETHTACHSRTP